MTRCTSPTPSLDLIETSVQCQADNEVKARDREDQLGSDFRHSGWHHSRSKVYAVFLEGGVSPKVLDRFARCGHHSYVYVDVGPPTRYRVSSDRCRNRWCIPCAADRAGLLTRRVAKWSEGRKLRFITLTLKHSATPLTDQLAKLGSCFRNLRRAPAWATRVAGGIAFLELKRSVATDLWHPHLHILVEGRYLPQAELRTEWLRVTGDSSIVDIRDVRDADHVARYVSAYATKTLHHSVYARCDSLREAMSALAGKRLYNCFGSCSLPDLEEEEEPTEWQPYCSLAVLLNLADHGDPKSKSILHTLLRQRHLPTRSDTS